MAQLLFPHNETAYRAAARMLAVTGKAAVIHPAGAGRPFIGFQLCADHQACWLSPSENIYETQRENSMGTGGPDLENISFYTCLLAPDSC